MNKEKLLDSFSFIIVILTLILMLIFKDNIIIVGMIAGAGSFLYGMCNIVKKNSLGCIFFSIGLSLLITLLLYKRVLDKADSVTFMICLSTFLITIFTLIFMYFNDKKIFKQYDIVVDGKVVDLIKNPNTKQEFYQVIYEYELKGKVYNVATPGYMDRNIPSIGDTIKIYVDSKDLENVYFDKTKKQKICNVLLCLLLMVVSLIILINLFR